MKLFSSEEQQSRVHDAPEKNWVYTFLPFWLWPYAQLARWDRPVGWQLLFWPCSWSFSLALLNSSEAASFPFFLLSFFYTLFLFLIGSILMRGAGCTYNDLIDEPIDKHVLRTQLRPLPTGKVKRSQAWLFLFIQLTFSLIILLQFNKFTIFLGFLSLPLVAFYPFAKRVCNCPQFFIGLTFSWGCLMGWASVFGHIGLSPLLLYCGCIFWVIGYDTIYAHQDKEYDSFLGIGSTALFFGKRVKLWLSGAYMASFVLMLFSFIEAGSAFFAVLGLMVAGFHMVKQVYRLDVNNPEDCLHLFRSNSLLGFFIFLGLFCSLVLNG